MNDLSPCSASDVEGEVVTDGEAEQGELLSDAEEPLTLSVALIGRDGRPLSSLHKDGPCKAEDGDVCTASSHVSIDLTDEDEAPDPDSVGGEGSVADTALTKVSDQPEQKASPIGGRGRSLQRESRDRNVLLCDICRKANGKYSFTCCAWHFCAVSCFKEHKSTECRGPPREERPAPIGRDRHHRRTGPSGWQAKESSQLNDDQSNEDEEEDAGPVLDDEIKAELASNPRLTRWYTSAPLRATVQAITSSGDRSESLARFLAPGGDFAAFVNDLIDVVNRNQTEQPKGPALYDDSESLRLSDLDCSSGDDVPKRLLAAAALLS